MKILREIFNHSLKLPKKQAAFALNRISMDQIIIYMFLLLAFASVPGLIDQIKANTEASGLHVQTFFLIIFFFIFYYLVLLLVMFTGLSIIAYLGSWVARLAKRKLRYSILWKMTACITTIPVIIFTVISFFYPIHYLFLLYAFVFHIIVFIRTILLYPKRRHALKGSKSTANRS